MKRKNRKQRPTIIPRPLTPQQAQIALWLYGKTFANTDEMNQAAFERLDELLQKGQNEDTTTA